MATRSATKRRNLSETSSLRCEVTAYYGLGLETDIQKIK